MNKQELVTAIAEKSKTCPRKMLKLHWLHLLLLLRMH